GETIKLLVSFGYASATMYELNMAGFRCMYSSPAPSIHSFGRFSSMFSRFTTFTFSPLLAAVLLLPVMSPSVTAAPQKGATPKPAVSNPGEETEKQKTNGNSADKTDKTEKKTETKAETKPEPVIENVVNVNPDELVNKPQEFLGKNVKFNANF